MTSCGLFDLRVHKQWTLWEVTAHGQEIVLHII